MLELHAITDQMYRSVLIIQSIKAHRDPDALGSRVAEVVMQYQ